MTVCSQCGRETTVPFKPTQGRPVYCRECFLSRKTQAAGAGADGTVPSHSHWPPLQFIGLAAPPADCSLECLAAPTRSNSQLKSSFTFPFISPRSIVLGRCCTGWADTWWASPPPGCWRPPSATACACGFMCSGASPPSACRADKAALVNLGLGCLGGMGAAALVLAGPLLFHAARLERDPGSPASLCFVLFRFRAAAVRFGRRRTAVPRIRISGSAARAGRLDHHPAGRRDLRRAARRQSQRYLARPGEYRGIRHPLRLRLSAQPRYLAAHRPAFRLELYTSAFRRQRQRAYNEI